ncbi:beta-ketoacyl-[acyl-carrier-protein] synthase family protein [Tautonia plasticadhaerens]|uniref:3-oxoacyl-[acyl-carrier-protein] synthase 2 n=1 Tax=Tautonia plasticadhaerens TaxID=2527974 RepID=A0A518GWC4_9BACT|nr:beta-ketoacyl-[acyl-carrier-protein] synthase II [Tautonia plasticadhaerens]QDV32888.1 3-oxoacyl-[acyl-carrier-protein] synthase 2 [Tautonia plasticadhaerens]
MVGESRRVVVTGMGMVTPVGLDVATSWESLREGRGGVGPVTRFDAGGFATRIAAELKGFDLSKDLGGEASRWEGHGLTTKIALAVASQAVRDSGVFEGPGVDPSRLGVYLGSGEGQTDFPRFVDLIRRSLDRGRVDTRRFTSEGPSRLDPILESEQDPGTPAGHVAAAFGAAGPNFSCLTACSAGAQAIGEAAELIRDGSADVMLAGGVHSMIHPFGMTGFVLLTAMSTRNDDPARASRPFDRDRDGFILGEGGGMLVLESLEHARARGAIIRGEVAGQASTADAFRLTDPHDEGRGAVSSMRLALRDAGLDPGDVDYVNAHGTSTRANDSIETRALKRALGDHAGRVPVSSTKSMTGHLIAAGGAVEAIACLLAIRDGVVPPTVNLDLPDEDCDLDYVPHAARDHVVDVAMSNSFGFGGQNTTLILRRFTG